MCVLKTALQLSAVKKAREAGNRSAPGDLGLEWVKMEAEKDLKKTITVPGKGAGLVRVFWDGRKPTEPDLLKVAVDVGSRPAGKGSDRQMQSLLVMANFVRPLIFERERIDLGGINPGEQASGSFICWSATRDLEVQAASEDSRMQVQVTRLTPEECAKLERLAVPVPDADGKEAAKDLIFRRVRCAFRVDITLFYQSKDNKL